MYFTYILKSLSDGSYYIGSCQDLVVRLEQHNKRLVKSTKSKVPWEIKYHEIFASLSEARRRELQIKSWKKRIAIERLIDNMGR